MESMQGQERGFMGVNSNLGDYLQAGGRGANLFGEGDRR